ncbi:Uncharacterised protein [Bordetella pertussis]|nr:Uncharacterised protein [Bordetella pertussis]
MAAARATRACTSPTSNALETSRTLGTAPTWLTGARSLRTSNGRFLYKCGLTARSDTGTDTSV